MLVDDPEAQAREIAVERGKTIADGRRAGAARGSDVDVDPVGAGGVRPQQPGNEDGEAHGGRRERRDRRPGGDQATSTA